MEIATMEVKTMAKEKGKMTVSEAGHKGGSTTARKYGHEFYEKIGRKGGQRVKDLIEKGKKTSGE